MPNEPLNGISETQLPMWMRWKVEYIPTNLSKAHIVTLDGSRVTPVQQPISGRAATRIVDRYNRTILELMRSSPEQTAKAVETMLLALMKRL